MSERAGGESRGESAALTQTVAAEEAANPFAIPSDEDVFLYREREAMEKKRARAEAAKRKVWEKSTASSSAQGGQEKMGAFRRTLREQVKQAPMAAAASATAGASSAGGQRRETENMADFISKKRDMFLLQMSLDTKREEIKKLEEKAQMKEEALRKSEMMLQEDAMRFDAFLKENDKKAHDALKRADKETKLKQEKAAEIKKLNQEISKVESEMAKYEDRLSFCLKYKEFLEKLTPADWIEQQRKEHEGEGAGDGAGDEGAAPQMYFKDPAQLLEIFAQLEERNLFLIQNVQETEEALEELKQKYRDTREQMEEKTCVLKANIDELQHKIGAEREKSESLTVRARTNTAVGDQNALLEKLAGKVREVYVRCGFDTADTDTLDMLREIEGKLEHLLVRISQMPPDLLALGEKEKETERRERVRMAKYREQQRLYDERLRKSNARANAEVKKRTGKPVMFRSPPIRKKKGKKKQEIQRDEEAEDIKKFFTP